MLLKVWTLPRLIYILLVTLFLVACENQKPSKVSTVESKEKTFTAVIKNKPKHDVSIGQILGVLPPAKDALFTKIEDRFADRSGLYMHNEAYDAFKKLHAASSKG